jgi:hypothetical protein
MEELLEAVLSARSVPGYVTRSSCDYESVWARQWEEKEVGVRWQPTWDAASWIVSWQEFCTVGCDKKEAEESPSAEAVARERLLETLQAGEDLAYSDL